MKIFFIRKIKCKKRNSIIVNMKIIKTKLYQKYFHFEIMV